MKRRILGRTFAWAVWSACLAFYAVAPEALAASLRDPKTGFSIDPPAGFAARQTASEPFKVDVRSKATGQMGCLFSVSNLPVSFVSRTGRAPSVEETNKLALEDLPSSVEAFLEASESRKIDSAPYRQQGVEGYAVVADPPPAAGDVRQLVVFFVTPTGRTNILCIAPRSEFTRYRPQFDRIIGAARLPKIRLSGD